MQTRPVFSLIAAMLCALLALAPLAVRAAANTSTIAGSVRTGDGVPVGNANVSLEGQARMSTASDAKGAFQFLNVPSGLYTLIVTKAGYQTYRDDDVAAFSGNTVNVNVVLARLSFSSLRTIANVSTREPGRARINAS
ncbi:MAG: carboxypeptidase-like regulatory domain-containing protein, partial [Candidatus Baltobacteraceae bacterium]